MEFRDLAQRAMDIRDNYALYEQVTYLEHAFLQTMDDMDQYLAAPHQAGHRLDRGLP